MSKYLLTPVRNFPFVCGVDRPSTTAIGIVFIEVSCSSRYLDGRGQGKTDEHEVFLIRLEIIW